MRLNFLALLLSFFMVTNVISQQIPAPSRAISTIPAVGERAPDFALSTVEGKRVRLSEITAKSPVVLIVLRGYPGYQCPYCNVQVRDFLKKSQSFAEAGPTPCTVARKSQDRRNREAAAP